MPRNVTSYQFGCGCADRDAHPVGLHFSETGCRLRQRVRHGAHCALLRVLPRLAARSQSNRSRSGKNDRLIMRSGARSDALKTSACGWPNISTVRQTNSVPNTSASTLPTCAARSSMCPSGSLLDDGVTGNYARLATFSLHTRLSSPFLASSASNRPASRCDGRCEPADRGCRQPMWDRRSARGICRDLVTLPITGMYLATNHVLRTHSTKR